MNTTTTAAFRNLHTTDLNETSITTAHDTRGNVWTLVCTADGEDIVIDARGTHHDATLALLDELSPAAVVAFVEFVTNNV